MEAKKEQKKNKKKTRQQRACQECNRAKVKCSGHSPCYYCKQHSAPCVYPEPKVRGPPPKNTYASETFFAGKMAPTSEGQPAITSKDLTGDIFVPYTHKQTEETEGQKGVIVGSSRTKVNLNVSYNKKENVLPLVLVSSKYCELLQAVACKVFQKEKGSFYNVMGELFAFYELDGRVSAILSAVTRSIPGENILSDQYLEYAVEILEQMIANPSDDIDSQMLAACCISSTAISFASVDQNKYRHYSTISRVMFENILRHTKNHIYWFSAPSTIVRLAEERQPKKILFLEILAETRCKARESDMAKVLYMEKKLFETELFNPPNFNDATFDELWAVTDYVQKLYFVRKVLFSYSRSLWRIYYAQDIDITDGNIDLSCLPNSVGLYLLHLLSDYESPLCWGPTAMFADLHPYFLKFYIFQGMGDELLSYSAALKCLREIFSPSQIVLFPGLGALASLHVITRYFIINNYSLETREALGLFHHVGGPFLSERYLKVLLELKEELGQDSSEDLPSYDPQSYSPLRFLT